MMNMRSHTHSLLFSPFPFLFVFSLLFLVLSRILLYNTPATVAITRAQQSDRARKHTRVVSKISLSATTNRRQGYQHYAYYSCILLTSQCCELNRKAHQFFLFFPFFFFTRSFLKRIYTNYVDKKKQEEQQQH